ncbi:hypothetical protein [Nocardia acidivorans]|uniref:hypothetical protein n=1 Tax=Nocardia acidivorans TaxID=404580 RepID=UPI00082B51E5|nr:hypothetical protein [Nocardia acidivorans]
MRQVRRWSPAMLIGLLGAILLLFAMLAECTLSHADRHSHAVAGSSAQRGEPAPDTANAPLDSIAAAALEPRRAVGEFVDCSPHHQHCPEGLLAVTPEGIHAPSLSLNALAHAVLTSAPIIGAHPGRGPPSCPLPTVSGRMLLTRLCIARR